MKWPARWPCTRLGKLHAALAGRKVRTHRRVRAQGDGLLPGGLAGRIRRTTWRPTIWAYCWRSAAITPTPASCSNTASVFARRRPAGRIWRWCISNWVSRVLRIVRPNRRRCCVRRKWLGGGWRCSRFRMPSAGWSRGAFAQTSTEHSEHAGRDSTAARRRSQPSGPGKHDARHGQRFGAAGHRGLAALAERPTTRR